LPDSFNLSQLKGVIHMKRWEFLSS
jgi:hypothetical protein